MTATARRVRVKICGIRRPEDARACADLGADALGLVLWSGSPRGVTLAEAVAVARAIPPFVARVGVFVDADPATIGRAAAELALDWIQLAGEPDPDACRAIRSRIGSARLMRTFRLAPGADPASLFAGHELDAHHVDASVDGRLGGTGIPAPWDVAARARALVPFLVLSGGLRPDNVERAVRQVEPWALDVASGVERVPGVKDMDLVRAFLGNVGRASGRMES